MVVIKRARPISSAPSAAPSSSGQTAKVRRGDVRRAVVVRTKYPTRRPDGRYVRFDDNAAVLVNSKKEMVGNRIGGVVAAELRSRGWGKSELFYIHALGVGQGPGLARTRGRSASSRSSVAGYYLRSGRIRKV